MRDAFGGTFMIKLMMIFLVIYVCFVSVAYNYAKAFRTKNTIVDLIERYEGYNKSSIPKINAYLDKIGYNVPSENRNGAYASSHPNAFCTDRGYCIEMVEDDGRTGCIVTTFIPINLFGIGNNLNAVKMNIPSIAVGSEVQVYSIHWHNEFRY